MARREPGRSPGGGPPGAPPAAAAAAASRPWRRAGSGASRLMGRRQASCPGANWPGRAAWASAIGEAGLVLGPCGAPAPVPLRGCDCGQCRAVLALPIGPQSAWPTWGPRGNLQARDPSPQRPIARSAVVPDTTLERCGSWDSPPPPARRAALPASLRLPRRALRSSAAARASAAPNGSSGSSNGCQRQPCHAAAAGAWPPPPRRRRRCPPRPPVPRASASWASASWGWPCERWTQRWGTCVDWRTGGRAQFRCTALFGRCPPACPGRTPRQAPAVLLEPMFALSFTNTSTAALLAGPTTCSRRGMRLPCGTARPTSARRCRRRARRCGGAGQQGSADSSGRAQWGPASRRPVMDAGAAVLLSLHWVGQWCCWRVPPCRAAACPSPPCVTTARWP